MNIVLCAVNSKYVHNNLAVRSIKSYAQTYYNIDCKLAEYSINEEFSKILTDLYSKNPNIIAFSCYIWNITIIERLCDCIKKVLPYTIIILGGPEVSYNTDLLNADYLIQGEGEESFSQLILSIINKQKAEKIQKMLPFDMNKLPFPYSDDELSQRGKIFYYEASRGCPYGCTYCLSGDSRNIKNRSVDLVKTDILRFISAGATLVKFVDRTFNCDMKRFKEILRFLHQQNCKTKFHFEIDASLIDNESIEILSKFNSEQIRLEAGLQSTNPKTLSAVNRKSDTQKLCNAVKLLVEKTNAIIHLDLIAGLPYEDYATFKISFNTAYSLNPHELQLGFLKLLKGAKITQQAEEFGYKYCNFQPYEVLSNKWLDYSELKKLKTIEETLELYHNSGAFKKSLPIIIAHFENAFEFYEKIGNYFEEKSLLRMPHSKDSLYTILYNFCNENNLIDTKITEAIAIDFMLNLRDVALPKWAIGEKDADFAQKCKHLFDEGSSLNNLYKELASLPPRERHKRMKVEKTHNKVWLIDYIDKKIYDITLYFG